MTSEAYDIQTDEDEQVTAVRQSIDVMQVRELIAAAVQKTMGDEGIQKILNDEAHGEAGRDLFLKASTAQTLLVVAASILNKQMGQTEEVFLLNVKGVYEMVMTDPDWDKV